MCQAINTVDSPFCSEIIMLQIYIKKLINVFFSMKGIAIKTAVQMAQGDLF